MLTEHEKHEIKALSETIERLTFEAMGASTFEKTKLASQIFTLQVQFNNHVAEALCKS